jgi:hypothetical protein
MSAAYDDGTIAVVGKGVCALRAACALAWQRVDDGQPVRHVVGLEQ